MFSQPFIDYQYAYARNNTQKLKFQRTDYKFSIEVTNFRTNQRVSYSCFSQMYLYKKPPKPGFRRHTALQIPFNHWQDTPCALRLQRLEHMNFTIRESNSKLGWFLWMRSNDEWVHSITATSSSRKKQNQIHVAVYWLDHQFGRQKGLGSSSTLQDSKSISTNLQHFYPIQLCACAKENPF